MSWLGDGLRRRRFTGVGVGRVGRRDSCGGRFLAGFGWSSGVEASSV